VVTEPGRAGCGHGPAGGDPDAVAWAGSRVAGQRPRANPPTLLGAVRPDTKFKWSRVGARPPRDKLSLVSEADSEAAARSAGIVRAALTARARPRAGSARARARGLSR
jgi:hypothetical protein